MTEVLTESFCERCGTRYTFESAAPRQKRLGGIKTLGRGLRNFVLSDDSSLDEAMAAARSDAERETTTQQLDAFHRTFNFCMSCRQYTCANCWNGVEARCQSCAPMAGALDFEAIAEPDLDRLLRLTAPPSEADRPDEDVHEPLVEAPAFALEHINDAGPAWPGEAEPAAADLPAWAASAGIHDEAPGDIAEAAAAIGAPVEPPAPLADEVAAEADIAAVAVAPSFEAPDAAAEVAAEVEPSQPGLVGLEPGASLDDAIAAYEAALDEAPLAAVADEAPVDAAPVDEAPVVAEPLDESAPLAASREPFAFDDASPAPRPLVDVVEQPTWPIPPTPAPAIEVEPLPAAEVAAEPEVIPEAEVAPEPVAAAEQEAAPAPEPEAERAPEPVAAAEALPEVAPPPPAAPSNVPPAPAAPADSPTGAPQWPTGPRWPTSIPARQAPPPPVAPVDPLTALMARHATEAMWALSSRDVVEPPMATVAPTAGVQPCVSCGISLSANARFCRRCGTSQVG